MKLVLKIKPDFPSKKKKKIIVLIKKRSQIKNDILQLFNLFKDNIKISKISRFIRYYRVTSENPAIILNFYSSIQEIIPEVYFYKEDSIKVEDFIDDDNLLKENY